VHGERLTTDRLLRREFRSEDLESYAAMCAGPEVMRSLSADGAVLSRNDAWRQKAFSPGIGCCAGSGCGHSRSAPPDS
jgi:RimJ/RimL family protein N-acetyltransferase